MNWTKLKVITICFCISNLAKAQNMLPQDMDTNVYKYALQISGIADYSSTSVRNEFSTLFINGGFLSDEVKDNTFRRHKRVNNIGLELMGNIDYHNYMVNMFKRQSLGYVVRSGYYSYLSSNYSKDAFGLLFYGNSPYQGDTSSFSGMDAKGVTLQKIGFGLVGKKSKTTLVLNAYNISSYQDLSVLTGNVLSDTANNSLQLELNGQYRGTSGANFHQGWGVGFDLDYRLPVKWIKDSTAFFQFSAQNIGFMALNNLNVYRVDTTLSFNGFEFSELFNNQGDSASYGLEQTFGIRQTKQRAYRLLPGFIQIGKLISENTLTRWQSYFGVRLYTTLTYNPLIFIGGQFQANSWLRMGFQGSYGGFAKFRGGIYSQVKLKKINLGIGTEDLYGSISKKGYGQSIYLKCSLRW